MSVFERHVLPNGLRVLTAPMPQAQSVSCFVMLAAGSRYETSESNGIAHFAEHMFFKGTERRPTARDISTEIDSIGGEFNAFTGKEITGYYVRCAGESRDIALDVLVDMLRNSRFDPEEIEREKGVIVEEMNMYFDTPRDYVSGVYDDLVYGDHPLGWDILGRKETIQEATRDTFIDYLDRWYTAKRMVIGVSRRRRVEAWTRSSPSSSGPARGRRRLARAARPLAERHAREAPHEAVRPGAPLPRRSARTSSAIPTATSSTSCRAVLGGGMSSRLFPEVRERRGLAYYVLAMVQGYADAGSLFTQAGVDLERIDEAIETIVDRAARNRRRGRAGRRAREGPRVHEGPLRPLARVAAGDEQVRSPPRGARGRASRPERGAGRRRGRDGGGRPARGAGADHRRCAAARPRRPVRRRRPLREAAP